MISVPLQLSDELLLVDEVESDEVESLLVLLDGVDDVLLVLDELPEDTLLLEDDELEELLLLLEDDELEELLLLEDDDEDRGLQIGASKRYSFPKPG